MLKDTDKFETSSHFSYNEQPRKKTKKAPNSDIMVFVSVFIIGVLIILGFAKILSPNVDVAISVQDETVSQYDDESNSSSVAIDERLHRLKLEDEGKKEGDEEMFSPELDEKVILPHQNRKTVGQIEAEKAEPQHQNITTKDLNSVNDSINNTQPVQPEPVVQPKSQPQQAPKPLVRGEQIVNAKVVVGSYATEKQAEVAKSIIQDAGIGVVPIVKNIGGYYTLQVGSYSSREKAQQAANNLLKSNFPARVVE